MGLPIENSYKTDPPLTIPEFSENKFEIIFFENINPKNPKNTPKNYKMSKNIIKKGLEIIFTVL